MLMSSQTLSRVFDNEMRVPADQDAVTLSELLDKISQSVWSDLDAKNEGKQFSARKPMISSLRRNLQREHVDRLIDLILPKLVTVQSTSRSQRWRHNNCAICNARSTAWSDLAKVLIPTRVLTSMMRRFGSRRVLKRKWSMT